MSGDWYPHSRDEQIHMMETWLTVFLTAAPEGGTYAAKWGIPEARVQGLQASLVTAKNILAFVKSGARTPAGIVQCNVLFKEMEGEARFVKKHYLLVPPLTPADLAMLLLAQEDGSHTPIGPPKGQPLITVRYPGGPHLLELRLGPLPGTEPLDTRGDYGYVIYRAVMPQGGATLEEAAGPKHYLMKPPRDGEGMSYYRFTRRKIETVEFPAEEAGMTAYFCSRYENQKGDVGAWGPVVSAVIP